MSNPGHRFLLFLPSIFLSFYGGHSFSPPPGCPVYDCGNGVKIKYPFWSTDNVTESEYCGYPEFGLSCYKKEPVLNIDDADFLVKRIDYANSVIRLVDKDVAGKECPRARRNISLGNYPLDYTDLNLNISFYFNCSSNPFTSYATAAIRCLAYGDMQSYVTVVEDDMGDVAWNGKCEANVVVTVMKAPAIVGNGLIAEFGVAMNRGFELGWIMAQECGECERTNGFCGYDRTAAEHVCFCSDGSVRNRCKGGHNKLEHRLVFGISASVGIVAAICILFFIYQRYKKNPFASSSLVSRASTSEFSSKYDMERGGSMMYGVQLFTYEQLEKASNNFDSKNELGEGGFGTVYYGKLEDGRVVAVKRLYENNYKRAEQFMNEVDLLTHLRHPHLVSLYGCTSRHSRELLLVYEYIPNGTVADHLHGERAKPGALPWKTRMNIAVETASALAYLHASDIIHRDVKSNNILLDFNFTVKVADFGLSRLFPLHVTHVSTAPQGTPGYVDPEYHECYQLTVKSDVYSFGVVLIELISSMPAVDITRHRHEINLSNMAINKIQSNALNELVDKSLRFDSDYGVRKMVSAVAELAFQCLQSAKEMRPTMDEVLETLKEIRDKDYNLEKKQETGNPSDNVGLLKSCPPPGSPDTVMIQWSSSTPTPITSS